MGKLGGRGQRACVLWKGSGWLPYAGGSPEGLPYLIQLPRFFSAASNASGSETQNLTRVEGRDVLVHPSFL